MEGQGIWTIMRLLQTGAALETGICVGYRSERSLPKSQWFLDIVWVYRWKRVDSNDLYGRVGISGFQQPIACRSGSNAHYFLRKQRMLWPSFPINRRLPLEKRYIFGLCKKVCRACRQGHSRHQFRLAFNLLGSQSEFNQQLDEWHSRRFIDSQRLPVEQDGVGGHGQFARRYRPIQRKELPRYFGALAFSMHRLVDAVPNLLAPGKLVSSKIHVGPVSGHHRLRHRRGELH